jgi:hypothetical protein
MGEKLRLILKEEKEAEKDGCLKSNAVLFYNAFVMPKLYFLPFD